MPDTIFKQTHTGAGLLITKAIAAYVNIHEDIESGDVAKTIQSFIDNRQLDAIIQDESRTAERKELDIWGYFDTELAAIELQNMGVNICDSSLTGHLAEIGPEDYTVDNQHYWIPSNKTTLTEIEADVRSKLKDILPDSLDIRPYICKFTCSIKIAPFQE